MDLQFGLPKKGTGELDWNACVKGALIIFVTNGSFACFAVLKQIKHMARL